MMHNGIFASCGSRRPDKNRPAQSFCMQLQPVPSLPSSRHCDPWVDRLVASAAQPMKRQRRDWTSIIHVGRLKCRSHLWSLLKDKSDLHALACVAKSRRPIAVCGHRSPAPSNGLLLGHSPFSLHADHRPPAASEHWVAERERAPRKAK